MRVGIFAPSFEDFGGVQHIVQRLGTCMMARGHALAVVAHRPGADEVRPDRDPVSGLAVSRVRFVRAPHAGVGLTAVRRFVLRFPASAWRLARALRAGRPDVIAAHCSKFYAPYVVALERLLGVPIVVHLHNGPVTADGPESPRLFRLLVRHAGRVIACSPAVGAYARANLAAADGRVTVVPYGVDHGEFAAAAPATWPRPYVLGVGRLAAQKGFDWLVDGFAAAGIAHDLVLAGDGPDRDALARQAAARGLDGRLHFLGRVDRPTVARLLRGAAMVAIPSRFEGYPQIALEAMVAGAPVVASALAVMPAELRDGETGLLFPPGDVAALGRALAALAADPARAQALGRAAGAVAGGFPGWEEVSERTLAVYAEATAGRESTAAAAATPRPSP